MRAIRESERQNEAQRAVARDIERAMQPASSAQAYISSEATGPDIEEPDLLDLSEFN